MASRLQRPFVVSAAIAIALTAGSCGGGSGIGVTLADFTITPEESSASAGELTFDVTNDAEQIARVRDLQDRPRGRCAPDRRHGPRGRSG